MKIGIIGGGSLGHVIAGYLAAKQWISVTMVTRDVSRWHDTIIVTDGQGREYSGHLGQVTDDYSRLSDVDLILLCLPGYAIEGALQRLSGRVPTWIPVGSVVSSTGFFMMAHRILPPGTPLYGFQRVPFIARTDNYGRSARLLGYKKSLNVAIEARSDDATEILVALLSKMFDVPVALLHSHFEASLTNSNPLLHPARLYTMWRDYRPGDVFERQPEFYSEWTDEASRLYIDMDREFQQLLQVLPVRPGAIPDVLTYYESHDAASLTAKLRSIEAFKGIAAPMLKTDNGYTPDFTSRYFTEDFPYGMGLIESTAIDHNVSLPLITQVYRWGMKMIER